jgi:hypothetical protein
MGDNPHKNTNMSKIEPFTTYKYVEFVSLSLIQSTMQLKFISALVFFAVAQISAAPSPPGTPLEIYCKFSAG